MKYEVFKEKVKALGYGVTDGEYMIFVYKIESDEHVLVVDKKQKYRIDVSVNNQPTNQPTDELFDLAVELAKTELEDRITPDMFVIKTNGNNYVKDVGAVLEDGDDDYSLALDVTQDMYKARAFTEEEVEELEKYLTLKKKIKIN